MTNKEKYTQAFVEAFEIEEENVEELVFEGIPEWDSVGHMTLITCLEEAFDIMMETKDIVGLNSYEKGIEILRNYDVVIE